MPAPHPVEFRQRAVELARSGDRPGHHRLHRTRRPAKLTRDRGQLQTQTQPIGHRRMMLVPPLLAMPRRRRTNCA
jgi:hypothetical protein